MGGRVGVDIRDCSHEVCLRAVLGKDHAAHGDAGALGTLEQPALVGEVVGPLAHAHDGKRGRHAGIRECTGAPGARVDDGVGDRRAAKQLSHGSAPSS